MTRAVRVPTALSEVDDLKRRVYDLERALRALATAGRPDSQFETAVFHFEGTLSASESDRYYPLLRPRLSFVLFSLSTAGSSSTVVDVNRNGTQVKAVTIGSSDQFEVATVDALYDVKTDYLTFEITTAGTGAAGLVCQPVFV